MIKLKGIYEWKLVDADTRKTVDFGTQENLITDNGLYRLLGHDTTFHPGDPWVDFLGSKIFISTTTINPNVDYRLTQNRQNGISLTSTLVTTNIVRTGTTYQGEVNFTPPVSPITIRLIGLISNDSNQDIVSFIELTTPITQQTNQFLFIRYRVEGSYTGAGTNGVVNTFVTNRVNNGLIGSAALRDNYIIMNPFKKPVDYSLCGRIIRGSNQVYTNLVRDNDPLKLAFKFSKSFLIAEVPGVHGSPQIVKSRTVGKDEAVIAISQYPTTPSVGSVFAHAVGDTSIFSNPGNPPSSKGNIVVTGTSNCSEFFKTVSFNITGTGEANDTPDINTGKFKYGVNMYQDMIIMHACPLELGGNDLTTVNWYDTFPADQFGDSIVAMKNVSWGQYVNGFFYFSQEYSSLKYICKWRFGTHESGVEVTQLDNNFAVVVGNYLWIATNNGLVKFNTSSDIIDSTYTTGAGLLNDICTDITYDDLNDILWIGHSDGVTSFNPTSGTVINTYTTASTGFNSLTAEQIAVYKGQLSARGGFLCKGGCVLQADNDDVEAPWIFDTNTNTLIRIPSSNFTGGRCSAVTLVGDGSGDIIVDNMALELSKWNVVPNTSSFSMVQSTTYTPSYQYGFRTVKLIRISNNHFMGIAVYGLNDNFTNEYPVVIDYYLPTNTAVAKTVSPGGDNPWSSDSYGNVMNTAGFNNYVNVSKLDIDGVTMAYWGGVIMTSNFQQLYGWNGSSWSKDFTGSRDIPDSTITNLINGLNIDFENAIGFPSNQQFIADENLMFVTGPGRIKSNLQTMSVKTYYYLSDMSKITERLISISSVAPYTYTLPEASNIDFKILETDADFITLREDIVPIVYDKTSPTPSSKQYTVNEPIPFSANYLDDKLTVGQDLQGFHGGRVRLDTNNILPSPLRLTNPYYVIYIDSTTIKLAESRADALALNAIDITDNGTGIHKLIPEGLFVFNPSDAGIDMRLSCQYTERH